MFKSEKHNLIADITFRIIALIVIYSSITFKPPLWFNILFPLLTGLPIIEGVYKMLRKDSDLINSRDDC